MTDPPQGLGGEAAAPAPLEQWPPNNVRSPCSRPWLCFAIALTAVLVATALAVALMRLSNTKPPTSPAVPSYSASDVTAAQKQLCDTYKLLARAVEVDTNGTDKALARIADTNGAVLLEIASGSPALDASHRDAARSLARAYGTVTAMSNSAVASDADYRSAIDDVVAKDAVMKKVCGGS